MNEIAIRYGQGLFELARENNTVASKKEEIKNVLSALDESDDVELLLRSVKVTKQAKKDFLKKVFSQAVDHDVLSLMQLLIDKSRVFYFKDVFKSYLDLADEELGIAHAYVYSARQLKDEDLERIKGALEKKLGKEVDLRNKIDPSLIAGIKVTVDNHVTDMTMKNKLDKLKESLLKGGQA